MTRILFWINTAIVAALAWEFYAIRAAAFSPGTRIGKDVGLNASMNPISIANGCTLLRSVSVDCAACLRDNTQFWPNMRDAALKRGCRIYTVDVGIGSPDQTAADIRFPSSALAASGLLDRTPTLLVLDEEGRVVWRRVGVLEETDTTHALQKAKRGKP